MPDRNERLLPVHWAAKRLGVKERTVRRWAQLGVLPALKEGPKLWVFKPSDLDLFRSTAVIRPRQRSGGRFNASLN
jgi:excisionase family DNA binding protein